MKSEKYFLGLDIGTDSVGYAVTDPEYTLIKHRGDAMWGTTTFEPAEDSAKRRGFRVARRRLDRRQARIRMLSDIFKPEIEQLDKRFFIRLEESALWREDTSNPELDKYVFFNDPLYDDKTFHKQYPTIHHLISELIESKATHDVRLVYLACAWLIAHRGHFLKEISKENLDADGGFSDAYANLLAFFSTRSLDAPWKEDVSPDEVMAVINQKTGVNGKLKAFIDLLFDGKKPVEKAPFDEEWLEKNPFSRNAMIRLLSGGKVGKLTEIFLSMEEPAENKSVTLDMEDSEFDGLASSLGDDGELLVLLRAVRDAAALMELRDGEAFISNSKKKQYETHKADLKYLKAFVRKYLPEKYYEIFRASRKGLMNYVAYSKHFKSVQGPVGQSSAKPKDFSDYLKKLLGKITVAEEDLPRYTDMMERLERCAFLPKQVTGENRIIPYQLYWIELDILLQNASAYLPFLSSADENGVTNKEKILSIFEYRIPYFLGPLHGVKGQKSFWLKRRECGRILPWNIRQKVDFEATEEAFIQNLTNNCTYLPMEDVLPKDSLLYSRFNVLNEINLLTIDNAPISVALKQEIFENLFCKYRKVTVKRLREYLESNHGVSKNAKLGGIDITMKSSLSSYHDFKELMESGTLSEADAEAIIARCAYTENKGRLKAWLKKEYPALSNDNIAYIASKKYADFGRLSRRFLSDFYGSEVNGTGEAFTVMDLLWSTNQNLMQILSDTYTFRASAEAEQKAYYSTRASLEDRLDDMYISGAVKRPIIRTLTIVDEVCKAMGGRAPEKIFVEMARGASEDQKGKRTKTRKATLEELYQNIKGEDARILRQQLEEMGEEADSRLQSDKLFLYYLQLGKCMYSGEPIHLNELFQDKRYDIDHIYPQHFVKDDSIHNNKVLVKSELNGEKGDVYPIASEIRAKMEGFWTILRDNGLINDEKFKRLTRKVGFTDEEKYEFINRQLVETRQSTKAVATLLKERFPDAEIVYVKAGLVSEFRHAFDLHKSRALNDLHHAKDAYLNIVVGNVYHAKFTRTWFSVSEATYSMKPEKLFGNAVITPIGTVWQGGESLGYIKKQYHTKRVHLTRYAVCKKGGLFHQTIYSANKELVPRKKGLPTEKYGGFNNITASFFVLVKYQSNKKSDLVLMPVDLMIVDSFFSDNAFRYSYTVRTIHSITNAEQISISYPLGKRIIKINTVFEVDGLRLYLSGKMNKGKTVSLTLATAFVSENNISNYIRLIEKFNEKFKNNPNLIYDENHSLLNATGNLALYDYYIERLNSAPFNKRPASPVSTLIEGREKFISLPIKDQVKVLGNIHIVFSRSSNGINLTSIGGVGQAGVITLSSQLSNWKKAYQSVRIVDMNASGLYEVKSENLLDLL